MVPSVRVVVWRGVHLVRLRWSQSGLDRRAQVRARLEAPLGFGRLLMECQTLGEKPSERETDLPSERLLHAGSHADRHASVSRLRPSLSTHGPGNQGGGPAATSGGKAHGPTAGIRHGAAATGSVSVGHHQHGRPVRVYAFPPGHGVELDALARPDLLEYARRGRNAIHAAISHFTSGAVMGFELLPDWVMGKFERNLWCFLGPGAVEERHAVDERISRPERHPGQWAPGESKGGQGLLPGCLSSISILIGLRHLHSGNSFTSANASKREERPYSPILTVPPVRSGTRFCRLASKPWKG